jgi:hypothetical protein
MWDSICVREVNGKKGTGSTADDREPLENR